MSLCPSGVCRREIRMEIPALFGPGESGKVGHRVHPKILTLGFMDSENPGRLLENAQSVCGAMFILDQ